MAARALTVFRTLVRRGRFEAGMDEEMRLHLDLYTEDLVRSGLTPEEALRRARMEFGSVDNAKTDSRRATGLLWLDELAQSARYAIRWLRKEPGFTATALGTLALCLGANLALFALVDAVLLRPLPFPAPEGLVGVYNTYPRAGVPNDGCSLTNYYERRGRLPAFAGIAAYRERTAIVGDTGATEREEIARVSPDFFSTLGLGPVRGRSFTEEETHEGADGVAIVTDAFWRQRLGADRQALGRKIRVNGLEKTVVGILPPDFRFLSSKARLYLPLASALDERTPQLRHAGSSRMIGRLRSGVSLREAQAEVDAHNAALEVNGPEAALMASAGFRSLVVPLHADHVAAIRPTLLLVQVGALFLLLIGAVNLVNLLLIRASGRLKELAVRQALGASRRQVVSEVLVETSVLTLLGGLLGAAVGAAGIRLLARLGADRLPLGAQVAFDARVAAAALAGALVLGIALGLPIAWYNLRGFAAGALRSESRGGTASRAAQRLRHGFIVAQIALAFVLLAGAGLLGLSLNEILAVSPGFRPDRVMSGQISLPGKAYPDRPALLAFNQRLLEELRTEPGVEAVGFATNVPLSGIDNRSAAVAQGYVRKPGESPRGYYSYSVDGDYFTALGFTLRAGRFLTEADSRGAPRFCVVDEAFARWNWPGRSALGQRLFEGAEPGRPQDAYAVVGVVAPVKQAALSEDGTQGAVYYPFGHRSDNALYVVVRTTKPSAPFAETLRRTVRSVDPELPVSDLRSMASRIDDSQVARRSPALLAALFSAIALLLTALGTYGVLSYAVAQRRREIGLRIALGARPEQVRNQFVRLAVRLLAAGTLLGLFGAWAAGRALQPILFQVPAFHWGILVGAAAVLAGVSLVACLVPTQRAAQISPLEALAEG